jgi:divinyl chlorophyllide a 8-vinyl-reductase
LPNASLEARRRFPNPRRILLLGATGTIGRATAAALVGRGHEVVCFVRPRAGVRGALSQPDIARLLAGTQVRVGDVTSPASLERDAFRGERFDVLVSCLASRTGSPKDAWMVDHRAHVDALAAARRSGVGRVVQLSAICVQKPVLAFQHAKLAYEQVLMESGVEWTIVRPTAFFKSLSGQVARVMRGKPFMVFGDGTLTACKPIADDDLAEYLADCVDDPARRNRILPIGGPGPAVTPRRQGEWLFELLGRPPRFRHVPVAALDRIAGLLAGVGRWVPALADKAELVRIGRYYATESMLVLDPATGRYDEAATPSTGRTTLRDFYARLVRGERPPELGDHAVF